MTTSRRPSLRRTGAKRRRPSTTRQGAVRRLFGAERLEDRSLMAGDLGLPKSEFFNAANPNDVNADGDVSAFDLLGIVNVLVSQGPGILASSARTSASGGEGEQPGSNRMYVDTNNDGLINAFDILSVVNEMVGEGEGPPMATYTLVAVRQGTNTPITSIKEGDYFEVRVLIQDHGLLTYTDATELDAVGDNPAPDRTFARTAFQPSPNQTKTNLGVFSAFLDVNWDTAQMVVQTNEANIIQITGSPELGQTQFTLTFQGQTTTPIIYGGDNSVTMANTIMLRLSELPGVGKSPATPTNPTGLSNFEVEPEPSGGYRVRYLNTFSNQDAPTMTGNLVVGQEFGATGVSVGSSTPAISGLPANLTSFKEAFKPRPVRNPSFPDNPINGTLYYTSLNTEGTGQNFATPTATGVHNAGDFLGTGFLTTLNFPGTAQREVFRMRLNAVESMTFGPQSVVGDISTLASGQEMGMLGFDPDSGLPHIDSDQIDIINASITVTEEVTAPFYIKGMTEDDPAGVVVNVFTDTSSTDGIAARDNSTPAQSLSVLGSTSFATTFGTVTRSGSTFTYHPNLNFNGTDSFTYTITDGTFQDTGRITINVSASNDSPVNSVPASSAAAPINTVEDPIPANVLTFSAANGNAITISDPDAGTGNVQVTLTVETDGMGAQGTLAMGSTANLTVLNNNSGLVTITGQIGDINTGLSNLKFTPRLNHNDIGTTTTITMVTSDLNNTGGTSTPDTDVIHLNVAPVNDAPTVSYTGGPRNVDEFAALIFNGATLIQVADVDYVGANANANISVRLTTNVSTGGNLTAVTTGAATGVGLTGQNSRDLTISGTFTQVNAALNGLQYVNSAVGADTLNVVANDGGIFGSGGFLASATTQIAINVLPTTRPRAIPDSYGTGAQPLILEGTGSLLLDVLNGPQGPDQTHTGETPVFVPGLLVQPGAGMGSVAIEGTQIRYTPPADPNFSGTVTFSYGINETDVAAPNGDSNGDSSAVVTIVITPVNDAPSGANNAVTTDEDTDYVFTAADFGFTDPNDVPPNNFAGVLITSTPALGTLTNSGSTVSAGGFVSATDIAAGNFKFEPVDNRNGTPYTSFTFQVRDDGNTDNSGVNTDPSANTMTINVTNDPDAPVAVADSYTGPNAATEDVLFTVTAADGVLDNDSDPDNDQVGDPDAGGLHAVLTQQTSVGTVTLADDGSFTWDPTVNNGLNFNSVVGGNLTFKYKVLDDTSPTALESNEVTVTIEVKPVDDAPVAGDTSYSVAEGGTLTVTTSTGLLRTTPPVIVTDVDTTNANLRVQLVTGPSVGTFSLNADARGGFTYSPPLVNPPTSVTFTYRAFDVNNPSNLSNIGTVTINITEFDDPPTANATATVTATEDTTLNMSVADLVAAANAQDEENSPLSVSIVSFPPTGFGTLVQNPDGSLTYNPPGDKFDSTAFTTFSIRFNDGSNNSTPPTVVTINLNEDNDDPVARDDAFTAIKDFTNQTIEVILGTNGGPDDNGPDTTANGPAADLAGELSPPIIQSLSQGATTVTRDGSGNTADLTTALGGKVRLVGGVIKYDSPAGLENVNDSFQYTISDGRGGTDTATVTVNVVNFFPKTIGGKAFLDLNNNGVFDTNDRALAGVEVHLDGTDNLNPGSPVAVNMVTRTNINGDYLFNFNTSFPSVAGLRPGSYTITQIQPDFLRDGQDLFTPIPNVAIGKPLGSNDQFTVSWPATNITGNVGGLNFAERGFDTANPALVDSSGLAGEILASSGSHGIVQMLDAADVVDWSYALPGSAWANLATIAVDLARPGLASALLTVTDLAGNTYTKTIFQDPHNNVGGSTPPTSSMARFRVLGRGSAGEYIIRLDGTAAEFGFNLLAAALPAESGGEGEGAVSADRQFSEAADEVFTEGEWA